MASPTVTQVPLTGIILFSRRPCDPGLEREAQGQRVPASRPENKVSDVRTSAGPFPAAVLIPFLLYYTLCKSSGRGAATLISWEHCCVLNTKHSPRHGTGPQRMCVD